MDNRYFPNNYLPHEQKMLRYLCCQTNRKRCSWQTLVQIRVLTAGSDTKESFSCRERMAQRLLIVIAEGCSELASVLPISSSHAHDRREVIRTCRQVRYLRTGRQKWAETSGSWFAAVLSVRWMLIKEERLGTDPQHTVLDWLPEKLQG